MSDASEAGVLAVEPQPKPNSGYQPFNNPPKAKGASLNIPVLAGGVAIGIVIGAGGFYAIDSLQTSTENDNNSLNLTTSSAQTILEALEFKDGTYTADATYDVPAADGKEHTIRVTVEIRDGELVSFNIIEINDKGKQIENSYLENFNLQLEEMVLGKPLEDIEDMTLVSGSTITADAFKTALQEVQKEAENRAEAASKYVDGEYYAEAEFDVPDIPTDHPALPTTHTIGVTVELSGGLIKSVQIKDVGENGEELENKYFEEFEVVVNDMVQGKTLDDSDDLSKVSGSTYTTYGFNDAVKLIINDAQR